MPRKRKAQPSQPHLTPELLATLADLGDDPDAITPSDLATLMALAPQLADELLEDLLSPPEGEEPGEGD